MLNRIPLCGTARFDTTPRLESPCPGQYCWPPHAKATSHKQTTSNVRTRLAILHFIIPVTVAIDVIINHIANPPLSPRLDRSMDPVQSEHMPATFPSPALYDPCFLFPRPASPNFRHCRVPGTLGDPRVADLPFSPSSVPWSQITWAARSGPPPRVVYAPCYTKPRL